MSAMSGDTEKLLAEASRLPERERVRLIERLLATLDGAPDDDTADAWEREIARRSREIEEGLVAPVPWSEVKAAARRARGDS